MARKFSGQRLRETRIAAGLKVEALALRIERSAYSVNGYELGNVLPSASVLGALAVVLDCSIDSLFVADEALTQAAA